MTNYLVLDDSSSVVAAWLKATKALSSASAPIYNLVYSVTTPDKMLACDAGIIAIFNQFALSHGFHPTDTVANTIFPLDTYRAKGASNTDEFYQYYMDAVLPRIRKAWGTYFERMISRHNDNGQPMFRGSKRLNPLDLVISKLKKRVESSNGTTTHYELSIDDIAFEIATYNPHHDCQYQVGGPCLSHISFKIDRGKVLRLSAFYRSHWYIERALGNLIGLARLQYFVAHASGATVGPLTIIASEAVLDLGGKKRKTADTRALLANFWSTMESP